MNKTIASLKSTTFAGRRFTRKQLMDIQQTVNAFPDLSHRELGLTICEHLNWETAIGTHKIQTCLNALTEMQAVGLFNLPEKVKKAKGTQKAVVWTPRTSNQPDINGSLELFTGIELQKVTQTEEIALWNEYVDRHHYLAYRKPIGTHLRYFIVAQTKTGKKQLLGCLIFSFATRSLACRDEWIGWDKKAQEKRLHLVLNNNRFLIFPWVKVKNLASKVLSLVNRQIADDWMTHHGFRPVLMETFVDPEKYTGKCYQASNWKCIGKTQGKSGSANCKAVSKKDVYVYPLIENCKTILINGQKPAKQNKKTKVFTVSALTSDDPFIILWQRILYIVFDVALAFDKEWQVRHRLINTMLLMLFIFRLVFSKNKQGYGATSVELWDQCRVMNIPLPQQKPIAASAFSAARKKLDASIFRTLNTRIIATYEADHGEQQHWLGHRVFGVDGTKINLPRQLLNKPYITPSDNAYYPQGLVSCLYQLKSKIPYSFELAAHYNERTLALSHLKTLRSNDLVVYDRGYFSYAMLYYHLQVSVDAVFRLPRNSFKVIDAFFDSDNTECQVTLEIPTKRHKEIWSKYPDIVFRPLKLRLVKYTYDDTTYVLGTTLLDTAYYQTDALCDLYHSRWGIEELYKISKELIDIEDFHAQSDRGIKQELYAHFVLITINRIFASHTETEINRSDQDHVDDKADNKQSFYKVNIKNSLITLARHLESLFLQQTEWVAKTINHMVDSIYFCKQKERPGRKYERVSKKPVKKWHATKNRKKVMA
jgi:hypothetical protein